MINPKMLKQIEQMQANMEKAQEELGSLTVEGTAGGGVVKIVMNGHQEVKSVTISPDVVEADDVETLQDVIMAAFEDAQQKAQEAMQQKMGAATGGMSGLGLPGLP